MAVVSSLLAATALALPVPVASRSRLPLGLAGLTLLGNDTDLAPGTGVLAADWIESQFQEISAACGNCLEVKRVENGVQYGDLIQFVDFHYIANVARLNAAVLADLAAAPGPPQEVHILTQALDNNTELQWEPPVGAPANTTYEVVWRPTEQPTWTDALSTGSNTAVRIALSKDNVVFGVRSVDPAGHRSIAVLPLPLRRTAPPAPKK